MLAKRLKEYIQVLENQFDEISTDRKKSLIFFSNYISRKISENKEVKLNFICTHNSRRSHMSQIWAQTAAEYYGIPNVTCYSGGTEATAFNSKAVKAIRDTGIKVEQIDESDNPLYLVHFSKDKGPLKCFSKVYNDDFNPKNDFAAIMTCSHADENCPVVFGAEKRFPIKYDDPKEFDGTELEATKYAERFEQIGIEMIYVFGKVII